MQTVTLGLNSLDSTTWSTHQVEDLAEFLKEKLGTPFPRTCRVYAGSVDAQHDVTPINEEGVAAILTETRHLYFVVYPEGAALLVNVGISLALFAAGYLINKFRDKPNPGRPVRAASPNNSIGDRQNTTRLLGRIPDNYGELRMTPDLLSSTLTLYDSQNREVEQSAMCLGRGEYFVPSTLGVYEGDSPAETVLGLSVEIYPPGQVPGHGGTPQLTIGSAIGAPLWNVYKVEAVNGQLLLGYNHFTIHGTQIVDTTYLQDNSRTPTTGSPPDPVFFPFALVGFDYPSSGVGRIYIPTTAGNAIDPQYNIVTDSIEIGDILEVRMAKETATSLGQQFLPEHGSTGFVIFDPGTIDDGSGASNVASFPSLSDNNLGYTVTNVTTTVLTQPASAPAIGVNYVVVEVAVPPALQTSWAGLATLLAPATGIVFNDAVLITPKYRTGGFAKNLIGPIFVNDPNMQFLVCNFVAESGLYIDDGKNPAAINVSVAVFITPADAFGTAIGSTEIQSFTVTGSSYSADTRALTALIAPGTFAGGRCLVSVQRTTLEQWRVDDPGYRIQKNHPAGDVLRLEETPFGDHAYPASDWTPTGPYRSTTGQVQEQLRWTHCYSLSDPGISDYGDVTIVMAQQVANTSSKVVSSRKLSIQGIRKTFAWDGVTFGGFLSANANFPENMLFSILKDPVLGNMPDLFIDFAGIQAAFTAVRDYFENGVVGNTAALNFGASFDAESQTIEDMIVQLCQSCFVIPYRDGGVLRAKPDIATINSVLLLNHRNVIPGSETRSITFATEAEYDGVKVDYADDINNTIQTYTFPSFAVKPRELQIVGLRDPVRAAFHAFRAYNHLIYQNVAVDLEALAEAGYLVNNDRILIADSTRPTSSTSTQDGEIVAVSGLNVVTSQAATIVGTATMFLQHPDGTVEGIAITASGSSGYNFVLNNSPSLPINTDQNAAVRTTYIIVNDANTRERAFQLVSKDMQSSQTWKLQAINYSHGYYFGDALIYWLNPLLGALVDISPYAKVTANVGVTLVSDPSTIRGVVAQGIITGGSGLTITDNPTLSPSLPIASWDSNTKAAWVWKNPTASTFVVIGSNGALTQESLIITSTQHIQVQHGGGVAIDVAGFPNNAWHHLAATYDLTSGIARLYMDGEEIGHATGLTAYTGRTTSLLALGTADGFADDLRLVNRVMAAEEIRELYNRTRM